MALVPALTGAAVAALTAELLSHPKSTPPSDDDAERIFITQREIKTAIDPQFGDLLPLPPSEPGSPDSPPLENGELPTLPTSQPGSISETGDGINTDLIGSEKMTPKASNSAVSEATAEDEPTNEKVLSQPFASTTSKKGKKKRARRDIVEEEYSSLVEKLPQETTLEPEVIIEEVTATVEDAQTEESTAKGELPAEALVVDTPAQDDLAEWGGTSGKKGKKAKRSSKDSVLSATLPLELRGAMLPILKPEEEVAFSRQQSRARYYAPSALSEGNEPLRHAYPKHEMTIGTGGLAKQTIIKDGAPERWEKDPVHTVRIDIVDPEQFKADTGIKHISFQQKKRSANSGLPAPRPGPIVRDPAGLDQRLPSFAVLVQQTPVHNESNTHNDPAAVLASVPAQEPALNALTGGKGGHAPSKIEQEALATGGDNVAIQVFYTGEECGGDIFDLFAGAGESPCTKMNSDGGSVGWFPYTSGKGIHVASNDRCGNQANYFGPNEQGYHHGTANVWQGQIQAFKVSDNIKW
ncbi:hypothetical protein B0H66DRAFT_636491 [Apodospora peruviana]|uniref:Uncharacterized protein n=1 Tax=Apodospora peruviana TaxID=516989 RepID=A0AAE0IIJ6_9PEZI|nr:hypothetical protein B0H66DRAFT_636491 [Apodospora peruviana]